MHLQYTTWLRWTLIVGLFAVPFISFLVANGGLVPSMFFPYITGKNFAFRILVELLLGLYIVLALREPKYRPRSSLIMWAALLFVAWMGVATVFSIDPIKSFWSNFERMEGYIALLHLFGYFVVAGAVLTADRLWERFFQTSVAVAVVHGITAFGEAMSAGEGGIRADSTFGNPIYLGVFLLVNFFLTLYLLAKSYDGGRRPAVWAQIAYGLALVVQGMGIFFTQTRGAILALAVGLIVAALAALWQTRRQPQWRALRRGALGMLAVLLVLGGAVFALRDSAAVQHIPGISRLASMSFDQSSTLTSRLFFVWPIALKGAQERPLTGWGQENFSFVFNKYYDPGMYGHEEWFDRAHNQFLDWLTAGGAFALLLYVSFYALAALAIYRSQSLGALEQAVLLGLLAAFGFHNLFVFDNLLSAALFFALLAFAHGLSRRELPGWLFLSRPLSDKIIAIAAPAVAVAVVACVFMYNVPGIARARDIVAAIQPSADLEKSLSMFEKTLGAQSLGGQEAAEQLLRIASGIAVAPGASPEIKERFFALGEKAGSDMLETRPNDTRLEFVYAGFLSAYGQLQEALQHLEVAHANSPEKQLILFQTGLTFIRGGAFDEALPFFQKAFELEPRYDMARMMYAAGLHYAGQGAAGDALLEERFGTVLVENDQLLGAYADTRQFDRIIGIRESQAAARPDDPQAHINLANAYFTAGSFEKAVEALERAAQLNPSLAPQARTLINQIRDGSLRP